MLKEALIILGNHIIAEGKWCVGIDHASLYAEYRITPPTDLVDFVVDYMRKTRPASPNKLALDVGCGTGQATRQLCTYFEQVIGVDVSQSQIRVARNAANNPPNVSFKVVEPEKYPVEDNSCDLVIAVEACHWFDLPKFYEEAKRILAPGGTLAIVGYTVPSLEFPWRKEATEELTKCYLDKILEQKRKYCIDGLHHLFSEYAELELPFEDNVYITSKNAPPSYTVTQVKNMEFFRGYLSTWSMFQKYLTEQEPGTEKKELRELTEALAEIGGCTVDELEQKEIVLKEHFFLRLGRKPNES